MNDEKLPRVMLLDLDDTLLARSAAADLAVKKVSVIYGSRLSGLFSEEDLRLSLFKTSDAFWGDPEKEAWGRVNLFDAQRMITKEALEVLDVKQQGLSDEIADTCSRLQYDYTEPFPGTIEALEAFIRHRVRLVLVANGSTLMQWAKIERFKLKKYFHDCLIEGDLGFGKPDIRIFNLALKHAGTSTEKVWNVGHSLAQDVQIPQMLGMYAVWNDYKGRGLKEYDGIKPDRVITSLTDLV